MNHSIVLLDAGGTLITERRTRDEIYALVLGELGLDVSVERIADLRLSVHDRTPAVVDGEVRYTPTWFREFIAGLLHELDSPLDAELVRARLSEQFSRPENFVVYADALDALEQLTAMGARLAVVSNWSDQLPGLLDGLGITHYFEAVVVSAMVGHTKPERGIFEHALSRLDAAAEDALHVGDHPVNDLEAARRAGLSALLLDRTGARPRGPDVIHSLDELSTRFSD